MARFDEYIDNRLLKSPIEQSAGGMLKHILITLIKVLSYEKSFTGTIDNLFTTNKVNGWTKSQLLSIITNDSSFTISKFSRLLEIYLENDFSISYRVNLCDVDKRRIISEVVNISDSKKERNIILSTLLSKIIKSFDEGVENVAKRTATLFKKTPRINGWDKGSFNNAMKDSKISIKTFINIISIITLDSAYIEIVCTVKYRDIVVVASAIREPNKEERVDKNVTE